MSLRNIGIVYRKELTDSLRDRRTLISTIVVPILLIPLMTIGIGGLMTSMMKKAETDVVPVMILGGEDSPRTVEALHGLHSLRVIPPGADYVQQINNKKLRAAVRIPEGFDAAVDAGRPAHVEIYYYQTDLNSEGAAARLQAFFADMRQRTIEKRMADRNISMSLLRPFEVERQNVATEEKVSGAAAGAMLPYLVILMCLTGAMYPAIDLTAGEKERGTMETILTSRVSRTHLVIGKFLLVLTTSLVTALLTVSSMWFSSRIAAGMLKGELARRGAGQFHLALRAYDLFIVFLMILPVAVLFSAALLAIALFAKSYKEAQSYISPLMIVVIVPAVASLIPGVELNLRLALVPILSTSLVSKEIFTGTYHWGLIGLIFGSSCVYAAAALATAVRMFQREDVLFRA
ncbi:MAG TPA: ABC transporter permease [Candidatus Acidoferrales bacterium]|nr:ABC transporter permease [Candidatus Acidoferrales bacterium]